MTEITGLYIPGIHEEILTGPTMVQALTAILERYGPKSAEDYITLLENANKYKALLEGTQDARTRIADAINVAQLSDYSYRNELINDLMSLWLLSVSIHRRKLAWDDTYASPMQRENSEQPIQNCKERIADAIAYAQQSSDDALVADLIELWVKHRL